MRDTQDTEQKQIGVKGSLRAKVITPTMVKRLKQLFNGCNTLLNELTLEINNKGIHFRQVDVLNHAMVDVTLKPRFFREFTFEEGDVPTVMQVYTDDLVNALKVAERNVIFFYDPKSPSKLHIKSIGKTLSRTGLDLMGPQKSKRRLKLEPDASIQFKVRDLAKGVNEWKKMSNHVRITVSDRETMRDDVEIVEGITVEGENDSEDFTRHITKSSLIVWGIEVKDTMVSGNYSTAYLKNGLALFHPDDRITMSFSQNRPLTFMYDGLDGRVIHYVLAPRTQREY